MYILYPQSPGLETFVIRVHMYGVVDAHDSVAEALFETSIDAMQQFSTSNRTRVTPCCPLLLWGGRVHLVMLRRHGSDRVKGGACFEDTTSTLSAIARI